MSTRVLQSLLYFVTLGKSETCKETIKGKLHHITVQYQLLYEYHMLQQYEYSTVPH